MNEKTHVCLEKNVKILIILAEQTSTSTFIGENEVTETPFSGFTLSTDKHKEKAALKLNRLKYESIRYESHEDILNHCLAEKLVPCS